MGPIVAPFRRRRSGTIVPPRSLLSPTSVHDMLAETEEDSDARLLRLLEALVKKEEAEQIARDNELLAWGRGEAWVPCEAEPVDWPAHHRTRISASSLWSEW